MRIHTLLSGAFYAILLLATGMAAYAQDNDRLQQDFLKQIEAIPTSPLEVLPASDCRLDDLEEKIFLTYRNRQGTVPVPVRTALQKKSATISFMRSHIDSLYYIQALQAVNQSVPDWETAMKSIEKSLMHNRFFIRSVIFKLNYLLNVRQNAESCLRYTNQVLHELSSKKKIRKIGATIYHRMLQQAEYLIEKKQYRDALDLCGLIDTYFQTGFELPYTPHKEKQLENQAHQGIYHSYVSVARKAFDQQQYQLAQQYALRAHRYYMENESYMNGVNYVLDILDKIAVQYALYAESSGIEEKTFYERQIANIIKETGIAISTTEYYDPEADILRDLALLRQDDTVAEEARGGQGFVPEKADSVYVNLNKLSQREARRQYENAWEQAHFFISKRNFLEAQKWFETARLLAQAHNIRPDKDLTDAYERNLVLTIEQLLNKAVYHLWNSNTETANGLYEQTLGFFSGFQRNFPDRTSTIIKLQQLLSVFQEKKNQTYCSQIANSLKKIESAFYRQASFGNYASAQKQASLYDSAFARYAEADFSSCTPDTTAQRGIARLLENWNTYTEAAKNTERHLTEERDTLLYILSYLRSDKIFNDLELGRNIPRPPSLFSSLSSSGRIRILEIWAEYCLKQQDLEQAQFILGYFSSISYRNDHTEQMNRQLRRAIDRRPDKKNP